MAVIGCLVLPRLYAEAEVQRRPELAGCPLAIHARGRVSALSPEAEEAGLRPGMTMGHACLVCPGVRLLPYDHDLYQAAQERVLALCADYVPAIEPVSLHELFLDLDAHPHPAPILSGPTSPLQGEELSGFTCHVGAGSSKLVARIAALEQPGTVVEVGKEARFLAPLPVSRLWVLDEGTVEHLQALGIHTIGLLQQTPLTHLTDRFGPLGRRLSEFACGVHRSPVKALYPPAIIEARLLPAAGVEAATVLEIALRRLAAQVAAQLRERGEQCRRVGLEVEAEDGRASSRWLQLTLPAAAAKQVFLAAQRLLKRISLTAPVTGLTLRAAGLERCPAAQLELFEASEKEGRARERLAEALSHVQERFGAQGVRRAGEIEVPRREQMLACLMREAR